MTITCDSCGGNCTGEVLKVQDKHFHIKCFTCKVCNRLLASGGYFMKKGDYYCSTDYHTLYGTKCKTCGEYVEGRVVTALGNSYHPHCFTCDHCKNEIRSGTAVTYNDRQEILCQSCTDTTLRERGVESKEGGRGGSSSVRVEHSGSSERGERQLDISHSGSQHSSSSPRDSSEPVDGLLDFSKIQDVTPVVRSRLGSEGDDPYCETCYHNAYGAECDMCHQYITGKVLEAGDKHFHPNCATCCKCGLSFDEGEDMCLAGEDVWHLDCDKIRAEHGIHTDTESSSEGSRSRSRTHSVGTTPSPTETLSRSRRSSSRLQMSRESSAGEPKTIYPLKQLQLVGSVRLPKGVERTKLEQHLSDEDFQEVFRMDRDAFRSLQSWKQIDLKKRVHLF